MVVNAVNEIIQCYIGLNTILLYYIVIILGVECFSSDFSSYICPCCFWSEPVSPGSHWTTLLDSSGCPGSLPLHIRALSQTDSQFDLVCASEDTVQRWVSGTLHKWNSTWGIQSGNRFRLCQGWSESKNWIIPIVLRFDELSSDYDIGCNAFFPFFQEKS